MLVSYDKPLISLFFNLLEGVTACQSNVLCFGNKVGGWGLDCLECVLVAALLPSCSHLLALFGGFSSVSFSKMDNVHPGSSFEYLLSEEAS